MSTQRFNNNVVKQFFSLDSVSRSNEGIADLISRALIHSAPKSVPIPSSLLSNLNYDVIRLVISNPDIPISSCLSFFKYLRAQPSVINPQKPNFEAYITLSRRLFGVRRFAESKNILNAAVADGNRRCSISEIDSSVCETCVDLGIRTQFFDMLFRVYVDNKKFDEALEIFEYMASNDLAIDERSCMVYLIELKKNNLFDSLLRFFHRMVESNVEIRVQTMTLAIQILCKKNQITKARRLMADLERSKGIKPSIYTYNSFIHAYINKFDGKGVDKIAAAVMNSGIDFNVATYTLLIKWYQKIGKIRNAENLFDEMRERGLDPDLHIYTTMIGLYSKQSDIKRAFALFDELVDKGLKPTVCTYGALIYGACKMGNMEAAELILREMQTEGINLNQVIFNTLIYGYCNQGNIDEAWRLQKIMEIKGFETDVYAYHTIATGLCRLNRQDEAKTLIYSMMEKGIPLNPHSYTTLIDMYSKEGNFVEAKRLLGEMDKPVVASFNALIDGYCKKGKIREAYLLRSKMKEDHGLIPDDYTYTSLIHGECIFGKTNNAMDLFKEMQEKGVAPSEVTYTALISGLTKESREEDAFRLYGEMTAAGFIPGDIVYSSLVGSLHGSCDSSLQSM